MATAVWFVLGKNLVRLVTKRGVEITEEVNNSVRATLQKQLEEVVGKVILSDSEGEELPLVKTLTDAVTAILAIKTSQVVSCPIDPVEIPGIGTAIYAAGDCLGGISRIKVPRKGIIQGGTFWDLDDEGKQVDLEIFKSQETGIKEIGDNAAWAPSDVDLFSFLTEMQFFDWDDHINNQSSEVMNFGKYYTFPTGLF